MTINKNSVKISQAWVDAESEFTQWHINQLFQDLCGHFVRWCDENYPDDCKFFRQELLEVTWSHKRKIEWFVQFDNPDAKTHFALVWHDNLPENV